LTASFASGPYSLKIVVLVVLVLVVGTLLKVTLVRYVTG